MLFKTVSLENAPALLRWSRVFEQMFFLLPTMILFYQYKGLTVGDFFLIQGIFAFVTFALEIPTGYIGDLFSRKKVIAMSFFVAFLGFLTWFLFKGFFFILLGEVLLGVSAALHSGTIEAYLYDVLKKQNKEGDIIKIQGKQESYTVFGTAFATFSGGLMYHYFGPDITALFMVIAVFIGFVMVLFLPEIPDVKRVVAKGKSKIKDILEISAYASTHHEIKWLMLYPAAFGAGTLILFWGLQPLMEEAMVPTFLFGVFIGIQQLFRGASAHFSHQLFRKFKTNKLSLILFGALVAGIIIASIMLELKNEILIYAGLILIGLFASSYSVINMVMSSMINHRIKSDERATVLSVNSMFSRIFSGTAMVALKFMLDGYGLQTTFIIVGAVILVLTAISLVKLLRLKLH